MRYQRRNGMQPAIPSARISGFKLPKRKLRIHQQNYGQVDEGWWLLFFVFLERSRINIFEVNRLSRKGVSGQLSQVQAMRLVRCTDQHTAIPSKVYRRRLISTFWTPPDGSKWASNMDQNGGFHPKISRPEWYSARCRCSTTHCSWAAVACREPRWWGDRSAMKCSSCRSAWRSRNECWAAWRDANECPWINGNWEDLKFFGILDDFGDLKRIETQACKDLHPRFWVEHGPRFQVWITKTSRVAMSLQSWAKLGIKSTKTTKTHRNGDPHLKYEPNMIIFMISWYWYSNQQR